MTVMMMMMKHIEAPHQLLIGPLRKHPFDHIASAITCYCRGIQITVRYAQIHDKSNTRAGTMWGHPINLLMQEIILHRARIP